MSATLTAAAIATALACGAAAHHYSAPIRHAAHHAVHSVRHNLATFSRWQADAFEPLPVAPCPPSMTPLPALGNPVDLLPVTVPAFDALPIRDDGSPWHADGSTPFGPTAGIVNGVAPEPMPIPYPVAGVPEPAAWSLLIVGFGMTGAAARNQRRTA